MNMKNLTSGTGLSMSHAQSFSNMCNQKAIEIANKIEAVNNTSSKIRVSGTDHMIQEANILPSDIELMLLNKSKLHAFQAFLMDSIKSKEQLIKSIKYEDFIPTGFDTPEEPEYKKSDNVKLVDENWAISQLSETEYNDYLVAESYAAHIGQFIHKGGKLDSLRKELPNIKLLEWFEVEHGKKSPVTIVKHHTSENLLAVHESLAKIHRKYEQKVNFIKAKIKNLVSDENARIVKENNTRDIEVNVYNEKIRSEWANSCKLVNEKYQEAYGRFEEDRLVRLSKAINLKIKMSPIFQDLVDEYLKNIE